MNNREVDITESLNSVANTLEKSNSVEFYEKEKVSFYSIIRRAIDIIGSLVGLIVLSPVLLLISACVKFYDGGNVFYKHKRIGRYGKEFDLIKFRSMKVDADDLENVLTEEQLEMYKTEFKIEDDPRITKIGRVLRKTSLDELPQMVNILKGELSIIGPRPIVEEELENYGEDSEKFLSVTPGLTGYWQAYARNDATYATGERQEMELYYVDNRSLWLDIKIFFKTFTSIFKKTGN